MSVAFEFKARDAAGAVKSGSMPGASASAVARELKSQGLVPLDVRAKAGGGGAAAPAAAALAAGQVGNAAANSAQPSASFSERFSRPSGKRVQLAFGMVLRELSALLRAGVPLMRALQLVGDSSADKPVRELLNRIIRDLDNGHTLVAAAEREHRHSGFITPYDVAMLQVGEQTGRLPEAFAELYRHREFARSTNEQVGAALRYPMFVILTVLIAIVVVNIWVIPSFAKVFAQARAELPMLTKLLLSMSKTMIQGWPYLLVGVGTGVFGWRKWLGTTSGRLWWDRKKLTLPIVGRILEGIVLARLSASLASSIQAGLTITDALAVTGRTLGNAWYESRVTQMCGELARGTSISGAARNMAVLPPTMLQLFAIGEESGSLEELMREISLHYQSEVDYAVKRLSATLEPILIWFLGIGVLILALGVFMPMWDLGSTQIK
jgi:MSHA biogenesis protein MshG